MALLYDEWARLLREKAMQAHGRAFNKNYWGGWTYVSDAGGQVLIFRAGEKSSFRGSTRNGITSESHNDHYQSFQFTDPNHYRGIVTL